MSNHISLFLTLTVLITACTPPPTTPAPEPEATTAPQPTATRTEPTLTPEPGVYFSLDHGELFLDWTGRALSSLSELQDKTGQSTKMLIENINFSPSFLEPFLYSGLCELCLDLGHLLLGRERVLDVLKNYFTRTGEIHLHGVKGYEEHLSLSVLSKERVTKWLRFLRQFAFNGIVTLEVFTPGDLEESMRFLSETLSSASDQT